MIDDRDDTFEEPAGDDAGAPVTADPAEVRDLAERMLVGLGLRIEITVRDAGETLEVDLRGADRDYLLDRRGEALNAVQYLLNRMVYRGRRGVKIHVDSDGFRKQHEDEIVEIARRTAEKVRSTGEESVLSPMNPYERRLVHLALSEIQGITTRSRGDGFLKRVAILPADEDDAGAPGASRHPGEKR